MCSVGVGAVVAAVLVALDIVATGHDEDPALEADHLDLGAIEAGQHRPSDYFVNGPQRRLTVPKVQNAIQNAEQWI